MIISYTPIGYFKTPFHALEDMPIQPTGAQGVEGTIEIVADYVEGLKDLDGFSHVIVLSHLHKSSGFKLTVRPFLDNSPHGVFSTRAPKRPNSIGFSIMRLKSVVGNIVTLEGADVLDGTPVLDLKPYVADFDNCDADRFGWLEGRGENAQSHRSDDRFTK